MANLTKRYLVVRISNDTGIVQEKVLEVLQRMLDQLAESLGQDRKVEFRKFGVFRVQRSKGRIGRNPNRPEYDIPILPRAIVKFRAGKELKARVMKLAKTIPRGTASASSSHGEGS